MNHDTLLFCLRMAQLAVLIAAIIFALCTLYTFRPPPPQPLPALPSTHRNRHSATKGHTMSGQWRYCKPWVGQLRHSRLLCDDWGYIRDEADKLIIRVNLPTQDEKVLNEHRRNRTDPTQPIVDYLLTQLNPIAPKVERINATGRDRHLAVPPLARCGVVSRPDKEAS